MPAERVSMRRIREILRLKHVGGASDRQIARSLSLARSTVALTLERTAAAGLRWPLPATLTDRVLEAMLYAGHGSRQGERQKVEPDWAYVHHELRRPGVTLMRIPPVWAALPRTTGITDAAMFDWGVVRESVHKFDYGHKQTATTSFVA